MITTLGACEPYDIFNNRPGGFLSLKPNGSPREPFENI